MKAGKKPDMKQGRDGKIPAIEFDKKAIREIKARKKSMYRRFRKQERRKKEVG